MHQLRLYEPYFLPHVSVDINLTVSNGEIITIVGENGIGKTSLMRHFWESHLDTFSFLEQKSLDIFYDRTLGHIKKIILKNLQREISKDFFLYLWSSFQLHQKENRYQSELSGGEGQALKICLALSRDAQGYILDEPSQYLDLKMKTVLNEVISVLLKKNKALLLVEHDYNWLKQSSRMIELGILEGTLKEVKSWTI